MPNTPEVQTQIAIGECRQEFLTALQQIQARLQTSLTVSQAVGDAFTRRFNTDFTKAFTDNSTPPNPMFPEAAWSLVRTRLLLKIDAIAALAASYALDEKVSEIGDQHLTKAVLGVKPDCEVRTHGPRILMEFCPGFRQEAASKPPRR